MLDWDDLRVFLALARNPDLRMAAQSIRIDPTTMVRRLRRLAEELDTTLFERRGGQQILTDRGRQLFARLEGAETAILAGVAGGGGEGAEGQIRVAAPEGLAGWFLGPRLSAFQSTQNIAVDLVSPAWSKDPIKREVDAAIVIDRPLRGTLTARLLTKTRLNLYAHRDYLASHEKISGFNDLKGHRLIGYFSTFRQHSQALEAHTRLAISNACVRTTSMLVSANIIATGGGIGILPYYLANMYPDLEPVCEEEVSIPQSYWLVVRQDVRKNRRVVAFVDWIVQEIHQNRALFGH